MHLSQHNISHLQNKQNKKRAGGVVWCWSACLARTRHHKQKMDQHSGGNSICPANEKTKKKSLGHTLLRYSWKVHTPEVQSASGSHTQEMNDAHKSFVHSSKHRPFSRSLFKCMQMVFNTTSSCQRSVQTPNGPLRLWTQVSHTVQLPSLLFSAMGAK